VKAGRTARVDEKKTKLGDTDQARFVIEGRSWKAFYALIWGARLGMTDDAISSIRTFTHHSTSASAYGRRKITAFRSAARGNGFPAGEKRSRVSKQKFSLLPGAKTILQIKGLDAGTIGPRPRTQSPTSHPEISVPADLVTRGPFFAPFRTWHRYSLGRPIIISRA